MISIIFYFRESDRKKSEDKKDDEKKREDPKVPITEPPAASASAKSLTEPDTEPAPPGNI